jgi:hypothetical protein
MRRLKYAGWAAAVLVFAAGAFAIYHRANGSSSAASATASGWVRVQNVPLSPREDALGVWTGSETLVLGGSDSRPCPPTADCIPPESPPLRDGAAFDPSTRTWQAIADAPEGFANAEGVVINGMVYVWAAGDSGRPGESPAFLAYDIAGGQWQKLPRPPGHWSLVAAGDKIVAFSTGDKAKSPEPDLVFDPATQDWTTLPDDPLPPSFDRTMASDGNELVLFAKKLVFSPGAKEPSLALAAALDLDSGQWRRLPDSETLDQFVTDVRWFESDGLLINPAPGESDGGGNEWGRTYPYGGTLDPASGKWSELPEPPFGADLAPYGAGIVDSDQAHYFASSGWILDAEADRWIQIPQLDSIRSLGESTVTQAGQDMFVFGGARFNDSGMVGTLSNEAWTWSPGLASAE